MADAGRRLAVAPGRLAAWTELHERVARLNAEEREVFDLLWYHELPQAEAAARLNVTERTLQRGGEPPPAEAPRPTPRRVAGHVSPVGGPAHAHIHPP